MVPLRPARALRLPGTTPRPRPQKRVHTSGSGCREFSPAPLRARAPTNQEPNQDALGLHNGGGTTARKAPHTPLLRAPGRGAEDD